MVRAFDEVLCERLVESGIPSVWIPEMADPPEQGPTPEVPDDLAALRSFVCELSDLLQAIVDDGRHIPPQLMDDVREAWPDARRDLNNLATALEPQIESAQQEKLRNHGMFGVPLRMKLHAWRSSLSRSLRSDGG